MGYMKNQADTESLYYLLFREFQGVIWLENQD